MPATELLEPTSDAIQGVAALPRDMAIVKMDNDSIMSLAAAHPRSIRGVLASLREQLGACPSFAKTVMYDKPVGKDRQSGKMKFARGLSVRAAEAIAEAYRYNRVATNVEAVDSDSVRITATFTDFQQGRVVALAGIVSKLYKTYKGGTQRHSDDRFYNVVVKAEMSKLIRDCILRAVPPVLKHEIEEAANNIVNDMLDESTVAKMVSQFSTKGVTVDMMQNLIGKETLQWNQQDRAQMLGIWNAIDTSETTIAEVFGETSTAKPEPEGASKTEAVAAKLKKGAPDA